MADLSGLSQPARKALGRSLARSGASRNPISPYWAHHFTRFATFALDLSGLFQPARSALKPIEGLDDYLVASYNNPQAFV